MELARTYGAAIVSADSRQIYRGFDIGTAKPTQDDRASVRHFGIDIADPTERYSAARWASDARKWMADARREGKRSVLLAGSRVSDLHAAHNSRAQVTEEFLAARYLVVDPGTVLASRIEARVDSMIERGWPEEILGLSRITSPDAPAWKASGYATMRSHVQGALDLSSARERVIIETRQYAKRQRTWFRHQLPAAAVTHVNPDDSRALTIARDWWEKAE